MKFRKLLGGGLLAAVLALGGVAGLATRSESKVASAEEGKATKDYPMIVNCWGDLGSGFFDGCDVGLHCWGGDLTTAKTIKVDKLTNHMGTGILPKGAQYMKVVRAESGLLPCDGWPSNVYDEFGQWSFDSAKNVITIKSWEGDQEYNDNKAVLIKDRPVFFDTQDSAFWFKDNDTAYAVTGAVSNWYDYNVSEGWNELTRINESGYMYFVPSTTIIAPQVIVTRNTTNTPGWGNRHNQTTNMTANYGFNPLYTTMVETGKTGDNYNWGNKSAEETASEYGYYFMDKVTCTGDGSIESTADWASAKTMYKALTNDVQGKCWEATGSATGDNIAQAMLRYDYIVFYKQYSGYDDFIGRSDSPGKSFVAPINPITNVFGSADNTTPIMLVVIISVVSLTAVGGYIFLKRRKED